MAYLVMLQASLHQVGGNVELARLDIDIGEQKPALLEILGFL